MTASGSRWLLTIVDGDGHQLGETVATFATRRLADDHIALMATWAAHQRAIVVEHLLLRPKFPGDALYPVCSDGSDCASGCADADPYSFRLTYVMPGWTAPFNTNLTMRAYADRTIQEQTPSHLLGKTCWVGNDGYVVDLCDPMIDRLAAVLADHVEKACPCANEVYAAYGASFETWFATQALTDDPPDVLAATLDDLFAEVDLKAVSCSAAIDPDLRARLQAELVEHFVDLARRGFQFERFEDAWCAWSTAEAVMDWTQERLQETVVELLDAGTTSAPDHQALCARAATILAAVGTAFRGWMATNIAAGTSLDAFPEFDPPIPPDVAKAVGDLLRQRYATYTEVSYRLHILLRRLGELRNTYPRATLHDCDAGSDVNPVRLGQTALGSN